MTTVDVQAFGPVPFDTGAVTVASASWVQVGLLLLGGAKRSVVMSLINGAAVLSGFKLTRADKVGGAHVDWLANTDFNTATSELLDVLNSAASPPNLGALGAGVRAQLKLDRVDAIGEIGIWAECATSTTLQATGMAA